MHFGLRSEGNQISPAAFFPGRRFLRRRKCSRPDGKRAVTILEPAAPVEPTAKTALPVPVPAVAAAQLWWPDRHLHRAARAEWATFLQTPADPRSESEALLQQPTAGRIQFKQQQPRRRCDHHQQPTRCGCGCSGPQQC